MSEYIDHVTGFFDVVACTDDIERWNVVFRKDVEPVKLCISASEATLVKIVVFVPCVCKAKPCSECDGTHVKKQSVGLVGDRPWKPCPAAWFAPNVLGNAVEIEWPTGKRFEITLRVPTNTLPTERSASLIGRIA